VSPHLRLLFVSPRFLFPLNEGGKIRTVGMLRAMKKDGPFEITLVSPAQPEIAQHMAEIASACHRFFSWPARKAGRLTQIMGVLGSPPASTASDRSEAGREIVAEEFAKKPNVVVADFPHSAVLLPARLEPASVMFTHNLEAEILERHAAVATGWRKLVWAREARKMNAFERKTLRRFDSVVAVSERDEIALTKRYGLPVVRRIETGIDLEFHTYQPPRAEGKVAVFAGAMDSRSNIDGIEFLLRAVWPRVHAVRPEARMLIAGRNPPPALVAEAAASGMNWDFTGSVADIRPHLHEGDISLIPLRVGSGTRLKAFEAIASGLPVVSTTLGVEGLGLESGKHYLAADTETDFADAILALLGDAPRRVAMAETGRALLEARYSWATIARQFEAICLEAANKKSQIRSNNRK
jgi:glycosyltransferase involved in cell wall biosynthesis